MHDLYKDILYSRVPASSPKNRRYSETGVLKRPHNRFELFIGGELNNFPLQSIPGVMRDTNTK